MYPRKELERGLNLPRGEQDGSGAPSRLGSFRLFGVKRHPELPPHIASDDNATEAHPGVLDRLPRVGASRSRSAPSRAP